MGFTLSGAGAPLVVVEQRATLIEDVKAPAALAPILPALFRRSRRGAARVIAVSEENRRTLETTYGLPPNAVEVVHNGVDLSRFAGPASDALRDELRLEREGPIVLTVSRLLPNKGHDDLIAAAPAILSRFPGAHFVFAGDGDQRAALEAQIEALHLRDHFSLLGFRTDVPDLMRGSDLFVLPSLAEGFSLALVEALAAGLPVVATRVGGAEEAIEDGRNGFLAPPADPAALAAAVIGVLEMEPAGRRALSKAARGSARRFSVEAMAERMFAIYREVSNAARN
jgi:glycosyltransferase involved in cell wall biosynthesis